MGLEYWNSVIVINNWLKTLGYHRYSLFACMFWTVFLLGWQAPVVLSYLPSIKTRVWLPQIVPKNYVSFFSPCRQLRRENISSPTEIYFDFYPNAIMNIEPKTMDFALEYEILVVWTDDRLNIPTAKLDISSKLIDLPKEVSAKLWHPSIYLANCKRCKRAVIDEKELRFRLLSEFKEIQVYVTTSYTFMCDIDLKNYPFDSQKCSIIFIKNGVRQEVPFQRNEFEERKFNLSEISTPPEFLLTAVETINCTNSSDPYSESIKFEFHLRRQFVHHIMLVFIPSMLIVILSWISFWLKPDVAGPRVALGLTSLLTLATQFNNAQRDLPPVATIKALDVWMFACMIMVFSSLTEFAISNYVHRRCKSSKVAPAVKTKCFVKTPTRGSLKRRLRPITPQVPNNSPKKEENVQVSKIDCVARVVFPIVFTIFNIVFWCYYIEKDVN